MNLRKRTTELWKKFKTAFNYDTDPENSGVLFRNHVDGVFFAFFTVFLILVGTIAGVVYLVYRHHR